MYNPSSLSSFTSSRKAKSLTRRLALVTATSFAWSFVLSPAAQAIRPLPHTSQTEQVQAGRTRNLSSPEIRGTGGAQVPQLRNTLNCHRRL
jgi:hypothetical protein